MKTTAIFFILLLCETYHAFHFVTRRWDLGNCHEGVDSISINNGNLFVARNKMMQWFRPVIDKPIFHLSRDFPRTINHLSVHPKSILVNMAPEKDGSVSETLVFANEKCHRVLWKDNTLYETLVGSNGYLLRSNFHGNITYGNHELLFTYNTRMCTNLTYSAMTVYDKYLWCATEYKTKNKTRITRIDAFDIFIHVNGTDYISSSPDMTFLLDNKGCSNPCRLSVSIEKHSPKNIVYMIVGYMKGGVNVAQALHPTEKKIMSVMCSNLPNEKPIRSVSWDRPYLFFLDDTTISSYRVYPRMDIHQFMGKYKLPIKLFSQTTQIVSIKRQVFWNGENTVYSAEIIDK